MRFLFNGRWKKLFLQALTGFLTYTIHLIYCMICKPHSCTSAAIPSMSLKTNGIPSDVTDFSQWRNPQIICVKGVVGTK